jgi:hypothetical protein
LFTLSLNVIFLTSGGGAAAFGRGVRDDVGPLGNGTRTFGAGAVDGSGVPSFMDGKGAAWGVARDLSTDFWLNRRSFSEGSLNFKIFDGLSPAWLADLLSGDGLLRGFASVITSLGAGEGSCVRLRGGIEILLGGGGGGRLDLRTRPFCLKIKIFF